MRQSLPSIRRLADGMLAEPVRFDADTGRYVTKADERRARQVRDVWSFLALAALCVAVALILP